MLPTVSPPLSCLKKKESQVDTQDINSEQKEKKKEKKKEEIVGQFRVAFSHTYIKEASLVYVAA